MLKYLSRANGTILPDSEHHNESMNKLRHLAGGTERQEFMILSGQLNKHNCQPRCLGKLLNKRWDRGERMENGNSFLLLDSLSLCSIFYFHSPFARRGPIVYSIIFPSNEAGSCVCLVARIES